VTLPAVVPALMLLAAPDPAPPPPIPVVALADVAVPSVMLADGSMLALQTSAPPLPDQADPAPAEATATEPAPTTVTVTHAKGDPFEHFNRKMFNAHEKFDAAVLRPAAMAYKHAVPKPLRSGIRNFLSNLTEPIVFLNDLLQLKPGRAIRTFGRFIFNSTLGLGGVLDIAKLPGLKLPHRDNGFGDTLGYYGVKPGPYLFLPFVGPTDLRDLFGGQADGLVLPLAVGHPFDQLKYQIPKGVVSGLDQRAEADQDLQALFGSAVDPYATLRSVYLQDRAGEIRALHGKAVVEAQSPLDTSLSDPLADPLADPGGAPARPDATTPELQDPLADPAAAASAPSSDAPELSDPMSDPASGN
jgi:phospholipid-binding lipoprotein MlaA